MITYFLVYSANYVTNWPDRLDALPKAGLDGTTTPKEHMVKGL